MWCSGSRAAASRPRPNESTRCSSGRRAWIACSRRKRFAPCSTRWTRLASRDPERSRRLAARAGRRGAAPLAGAPRGGGNSPDGGDEGPFGHSHRRTDLLSPAPRRDLRALRSRTGPDPDLEIELALLEARSGQLDSAAERLWSPALTAALSDSMPVTRRERYGWDRGPLWLNGSFDGWNWYVARARAEVASSLGRW